MKPERPSSTSFLAGIVENHESDSIRMHRSTRTMRRNFRGSRGSAEMRVQFRKDMRRSSWPRYEPQYVGSLCDNDQIEVWRNETGQRKEPYILTTPSRVRFFDVYAEAHW